MDDLYWMHIALDEAKLALKENEVPVGALIIKDGQIVARAHNACEAKHDPMLHAEMIALRSAHETLGSLDGCTLYVTLEPCIMCTGALLQARVDRVVFGCRDPKGGALRSLFALGEDPRLNHRMKVDEGLFAEESAKLLRNFFDKIRKT